MMNTQFDICQALNVCIVWGIGIVLTVINILLAAQTFMLSAEAVNPATLPIVYP